MNGQREAAALAYAEAVLNWPTKSQLPEARIISLLAAVSGNGLDDFVLKHTEAPFRSCDQKFRAQRQSANFAKA
ncbi:hypothetical protein [Caenimonas soli]|uniref:hypothetical protein n=1 Tax=Caenimonas soli TaxID=2735555 RepID=UPI001557FDCF|nr:hypothetical protein [Caenimonas soli]NPC56897.1 hypothetical protein [Caenimonas soli]